MFVSVNGEEFEADDGSVLGDVIHDQVYHPGALIAIVRSADMVKKETTDFELSTSKGSMVLSLNDSVFAERLKGLIPKLVGIGIRWRTGKLLALGSFPTDIELAKGMHSYRRYDCFFALGGYDNSTTYMMISKADHQGQFGVEGGIFGRITRGRHLLEGLDEDDVINDIRPIILEMKATDAFITDDLDTPLEDGMSIQTYASIDLSRDSPVGSEHFLVLSEKGHIPITDSTASYNACSQNLDVSLVSERIEVRERGQVTVRTNGAGEGRVYFYKTRRQMNNDHTMVGNVEKGLELVELASSGSVISVRTDPERILTIGKTQAEGMTKLAEKGFKQVRTGLTDDDAIIVEQEPELTMDVLESDHVETFGVRKEAINEWAFYLDQSPKTLRYFRKMTGLDHKPIGTLKVHFTYPGMPLITFEGNTKQGLDISPEKTFGEVSGVGDIGVTNQSRPQKGLIGVRLDDSDEFGPTGEERYGTNILGRVMSPLDMMMREVKDGGIIYVREVEMNGEEKDE